MVLRTDWLQWLCLTTPWLIAPKNSSSRNSEKIKDGLSNAGMISYDDETAADQLSEFE